MGLLQTAGRRLVRAGLPSRIACFAWACAATLPLMVLPASAAVAGGQLLSVRPAAGTTPEAASRSLRAWEGLKISAVEFIGVDRLRLVPLPSKLPVQPGRPLSAAAVRQSLRELYATGLYQGILVEGERDGDTVILRFSGQPQYFLGRVTVDGVKSDRLASLLDRSTRLRAGTRYSSTKMARATNRLKEALKESGFYQATVEQTTDEHPNHAQVDIDYHVNTGPQARVGEVAVAGSSGMTVSKFRKRGKLKAGSRVTRDTVNRALNRLAKHYKSRNRLEADVALASKQYQTPSNRLDLNFNANQGPLVEVRVNGVKLSKGKIKALVPVYEEGAVDEDLLNEGDRRVRDYFQRQGYFNAHVTHTRNTTGTGAAVKTVVIFNVTLGVRREVRSVTVTGNHYFSNSVIFPRLSVRAATLFMRHGNYSQALVESDVGAITALYQSNGFSDVQVTPEVEELPKGHGHKTPGLAITYVVHEGVQDRIGKYQIVGNKKVPLEILESLLSTQTGQPYSAATIMGDRDAILTYYGTQGFDHARVTLSESPESKHSHVIDVTFHVVEGEQIFVNHVLISGLHFTRRSTVEPNILIKPGRPLNLSQLRATQRRLYDLTLFNEVTTAVQNPRGDQQYKNVLLQFTEARRWDLSYGFGFQTQTGNPSTNCPSPASLIALGINPENFDKTSCGTNGKTGVSALVMFDISRINLFGRDQSFTLRTEYGTLEQSVTTFYSLPNIFNHRSLNFSIGGGYTSAQDVTTYAASRLEGSVRLTEHPTPANTLLYQFVYRRVKVDPSSVQVAPNEISLVSQPVRVGGPEITWVRDTRRPTPLNATSGTYTSADEFITDNVFESEANFNRLDLTNSSYYKLNKRGLVLARNTRFGFERAFGEDKYEYIPLPERLYAGGAQSLRGFSINSAGPRDSLTGFPIGGAGVFVNSTELRFPNPTLPYFGNALGFVLFHDMGNVFNNSSDIWRSAFRIKQPHSWTCRDLTLADQQKVTRSSSTNTTGTCDFNDFSHDVGLGLRYHTPVGPIRLDFSYNLNPPIYPVLITYGGNSADTSSGQPNPAYVGQASHFNFFFSIGQAF